MRALTTARALGLLVALALYASGCASLSGYRHPTQERALPRALHGSLGSAQDFIAPIDLSAAPQATPEVPTRQGRVSLSEVVAVARRDASDVLEAAARLDAASGRVQEADGALLPSFGAEVGGSYLHGRAINTDGSVVDGLSFGRFEPSVSVFYRINPGAAVMNARRWRAEAESVAYEAQEAERVAALQASLAYFDLVLAHASLQVAEGLVTDSERLLGITQARAQAQVGSGADVARAEAEVARAQQTKLRARSRWEQASVRLAVLLRRCWRPPCSCPCFAAAAGKRCARTSSRV